MFLGLFSLAKVPEVKFSAFGYWFYSPGLRFQVYFPGLKCPVLNIFLSYVPGLKILSIKLLAKTFKIQDSLFVSCIDKYTSTTHREMCPHTALLK